jgi:NAD(P)-dependent dehydrogenase (short-subunit alcohol dehydrogenase family)
VKKLNVLNMFSLKGKTALVTGGAGLYGRQIVYALAQAGAKTYTASRNMENSEDFAENARRQGLDVHALKYDQGSHESILSLKESIQRDSGNLHILVNNSVMRSGHIEELTEETLSKDMEVNSTGLILMCREFGSLMAAQGGGSIINIGSIYGLVGYDDWLYRDTGLNKTGGAAYYYNKGGMQNVTRFFAGYYGPKGVRVNCIHPGGHYTTNLPDAFVKNYTDKTFLKRMADDTDLMGIIVFLASDASAYITGTNIPVDGGLTAK